jgi:hypothetical protein
VVQFTQLTLLSPPSSNGTKPSSKKRSSTNRRTQPSTTRTKKAQVELYYLAFDDDYFWELIKKDYASAWRYVDRMTRF